ncbi:MAG: TonB-dependent receptor [Pseudomonadales bacterium]|nr:TonB-dependent receptor [Pseudomonadales bacterium]
MKTKSLLALFLLSQSYAFAADNIMEEVVVTGTRTDKTYQQNPYSISLITSEMIENNTYDQLADLLIGTPGITLSDAGQAGQKRIRIRGEEARRMALLVDGQEFGDHREVGVPMLVDITRIQKIEIIRGPASVLYGPKAMGGVINVITRPEAGASLKSQISASYNSSTEGHIISGNFQGSKKNVYWSFGGFDNDQGLRNTPDGETENTLYSSHGYHGEVQYRVGQHSLNLGYENFVSASVIYVEPKLRFTPPFLDFTIDSPVRNRNKLRLDYGFVNFNSNSHFSSLKIDAYQQKSDRVFNTFLSVKLTPSFLLDTSIDTVSDLVTNGFNLQSDWDIFETSSLIAGIQWVEDEIKQERFRTLETNGRISSQTSSFDDADLTTAALYVQTDIELGESFNLLAGLRSYYINGALSTSSSSTVQLDYSDQHAIASLALVYKLSDSSTFRLNSSQGYIYPSLLNLAMGAFAGSRYINPNAELKPETSITYELGYRYKSNHTTLDITGFATNADDYIDHVSCLVDDQCLNSRDKIYKNIGQADTHGIELAVTYQNQAWEVYSQLTWLKRKKKYEGVDTWDSGVPEITGQLGGRYTSQLFGKRLNIGLLGRFEGHTKEQISTRRGFKVEENSGYAVLDTDLSYYWNKQTSFHLTIANLTDKTYHSATENLDAAGRHLRLKANYNF